MNALHDQQLIWASCLVQLSRVAIHLQPIWLNIWVALVQRLCATLFGCKCLQDVPSLLC
jgi:hypothetical protein